MMMPLQGPLKGIKILGAPTPRRSQPLFQVSRGWPSRSRAACRAGRAGGTHPGAVRPDLTRYQNGPTATMSE